VRENDNPYETGATESLQVNSERQAVLLVWLLVALTVYYVFSSITLPWADDLWWGEIPVLALFQIPKSTLFDRTSNWMVKMAFELGIDRGSHSPTSIAVWPWAITITIMLPSVPMISAVAICRRWKPCQKWIWLLIAVATIDAMTTIWFERTSRLSLF
jgi:hypothetical protein